jgi:hypothetical protein
MYLSNNVSASSNQRISKKKDTQKFNDNGNKMGVCQICGTMPMQIGHQKQKSSGQSAGPGCAIRGPGQKAYQTAREIGVLDLAQSLSLGQRRPGNFSKRRLRKLLVSLKLIFDSHVHEEGHLSLSESVSPCCSTLNVRFFFVPTSLIWKT